MLNELLDMVKIVPADEARQQIMLEQMPVHMELLPAWKQLIMESRQLQTAAMLLMAESKRQKAVLKQHVAAVRQQRSLFLDL